MASAKRMRQRMRKAGVLNLLEFSREASRAYVCVDARDGYEHEHVCIRCLAKPGCVEYFENDFCCDKCASQPIDFYQRARSEKEHEPHQHPIGVNSE